MPTITSEKPEISARITSPRDWLPVVLWTAAVILTAAAACLRPEALPPAARATLGPFATLAAIIAGSVLADRLGVFRMLAGLLIRDRAPRAVAAASVLAFTAVVSGLAYLRGSWLAWLLVAAVTVGPLSLWLARNAGPGPQAREASARPSARAALDL